MPIGKGRRPAPPGYMTAAQAGELLGQSKLYKLAQAGQLHRHTPPGQKHGYYPVSEVQAIVDADNAFYHAAQEESIMSTATLSVVSIEDAYFTPATPGDMDALYRMAVKLFPKTANGARRREWMTVEPRGHYIMKTAAGAVVAYFYILSLRPDRLAAYLHDALPSSAITRDDVEPFVPGRPAQAVVLGGIGSDPDRDGEARTAYTAMLLRGVRHHLELLGEQGVTIAKFYAFSETHDGIALCVKLRMQEWEPPVGRRCTFVLDAMTSNAFFLRDYRRGLARWQQEHQQVSVPAWNAYTPGATRERPPATRDTRPSRGEPLLLPPGYVLLNTFRHGMPDGGTLARARERGAFHTTPGDWQDENAHTGKHALSPEQQAEYYQAMYNRPGFVPCERCPHTTS